MARKNYAYTNLEIFCTKNDWKIAERALNDSVIDQHLTAVIKYVGTTFDCTHTFQFGNVMIELTPSKSGVNVVYRQGLKTHRKFFQARAFYWKSVLCFVIQKEFGDYVSGGFANIAKYIFDNDKSLSNSDVNILIRVTKKCIALGWLLLEDERKHFEVESAKYKAQIDFEVESAKYKAQIDKMIAELEAKREARIKRAQLLFQ
ncbi:MAG: hypothetical protein WC455_26725 [Dehalococcoidia bacterium]|jgi:hypothetical protein